MIGIASCLGATLTYSTVWIRELERVRLCDPEEWNVEAIKTKRKGKERERSDMEMKPRNPHTV